jgi:hypothetical protein
MIGGHDDRRRPRGAAGGLEQGTEGLVHVRNFALVWAARVLRVERRRRRVGRVRIEHVDPGEPSPLTPADPFQGGGDDLAGGALGQRKVGRVAGPSEAVVINVEPAVQPEAPLERHAADECARREPLGLQHGGDRRQPRLQPVSAVIADAVFEGIGTGKDAGVRGPRQDGVRVCEVEPRSVRRERVEIRRARRAAVAAERVGAQRVDGHEQDVLIRLAIEGRSRLAGRDRPDERAHRDRRRGQDGRAPRSDKHD